VLGRSHQLKRLLNDYPVYFPPHPGPCRNLLLDQALKNYKFFEQEKSHRLAVLSELLDLFEIIIDTQNPERHSLMLLDAWAYQQWEGVFIPALLKSNIYTFPTEGEIAHVRSLLFDISILLGECYLSLSHKSEWFLDVSNQSKDDEMSSFNRVIIKQEPRDTNNFIDMEAQVFFHYGLQKKNPALIEADQKTGRILAEPVISLMKD
jgi:hypothetical protein